MPRCMIRTSPRGEVGEEVLGAPAKRQDATPGEPLGEAVGKWIAQVRPAQLDALDEGARHARVPGHGGQSRPREARASGRDSAEPRPCAMPRAERRTHARQERYAFRLFDRGPGEKQGLVDEVFHKVAHRYDLMNDLMSGGLHRLWKEMLVTMLDPPRRRAFRHLDVAGGTADVAFRVRDAGGELTHVTVLDINAAMLDVGRERALARGDADRLDFVQANAESLPFEDRTFEGYTIAFGIRNVPRIENALAEAHRTLRRGGRFLCLEFSAADVPGLDKIYDLYSFRAIPAIGRMVTGEAEPYRYLVESIRRFPNPDAFAQMIRAAGFDRVSHRPLTGAIASIHSAWKL